MGVVHTRFKFEQDEKIIEKRYGRLPIILKKSKIGNGPQIWFLNTFKQYICELSNLYLILYINIFIFILVCIINRRKDTKPNSPILLTRRYEGEDQLIWPELESSGDIVIIEAEDTVTLLCPVTDANNNKFVKLPDVNEIDVVCDHQDIFTINNESYHLSELDCVETPKAVVIKTGEHCLGNDTELLLIGYKAKVFVEVYKVCYDTMNGMPLITNTIMFKSNDIGPGIDQNWYIDEAFEMGNEAYTCNEMNTSCCYAKEQLVNALDVTYGSSQIITYVDHVNSIPVWQPCSTSKRVS